jgi:signal transduction histidine kinase
LNVSTIADQIAPTTHWNQTRDTDHFVQFYESDTALLESVSGYVESGLTDGAAAIVIATREHLEKLERHWEAQGLNLETARRTGQYTGLAADETLSKLLLDDWPQSKRFYDVIGSVVAEAAARFPRVVAFGEMVALLWQDGKQSAAIHLEELWNDLQKRHPFALFCAYPMSACAEETHTQPFRGVCAAHSHVIPAESYTALTDPQERLAAISQLQQKARALETEVRIRKRLEKELQKKLTQLTAMDRRKDEFLAMLGHELRNPLAAIGSLAELMRRQRTGPGHSNLPLCEMLGRQVMQMARLVDDLLDASRITQGKITLQKEPLELMAIVARAIETTRPATNARGHRLRVVMPEEPIRIRGDLTRLVQVFSNLLNNAAKYTPPGGQIAVTAKARDTEVELRVQDNGVGMAPELLPRVFDLFSQADQSIERSDGGLGVGLALVRCIVELHGGRVEALSDGPGAGSEFVVRLPLLDEASIEREAPAATIPVNPTRILIVDDNRDAAESLAALLRSDGHQAATAFNGYEALAAVQSHKPQVVLLDIGLPGMNGYEVAQRLREAGSTARLIALTGYGQPEDRERTQRAGFHEHLTKPLDMNVLASVLA